MKLPEMVDDLYDIEWLMHKLIRDHGNHDCDFERSVKRIVNMVQVIRHEVERELGI